MSDNSHPGASLFQELIESWPQPVWTASADGAFTRVNRRWVEYSGLPEEQHLGWKWLELIHPDDLAGTQAEWFKAVASGQHLAREHRIRGGNGHHRWFESIAIPLHGSTNSIICWAGMNIDIHRAREARLASEREKVLLDQLVDLSPAAFFSHARRPDGSAYFKFAGPDVSRLLGLSADDLDKPDFDTFSLIHPDDRDRVRLAIDTSARTMATRHCEFRLINPEMDERWIESHSKPIIDEQGTLVWHGFITDITERKHEKADQRFLLDLDSQLQAAATPQAIAAVATQMMAEHFAVDRCTLHSVDTSLGEVTWLSGHSTTSALPPTRVATTVERWLGARASQLLASGNTVSVANTASNFLTAAEYATAYQPSGVGAFISTPLLLGRDWVSVLVLISSQPRAWSQREINLARSAAERIWRSYGASQSLAAERALYNTLVESKARLRMALEASAIGIWETDLLTQEIHWDERSKAIYGYPPDFVLSRSTFQRCVHPEDLDQVIRAEKASYDIAGDGRFEMHHRVLFWVDCSIRHVYVRGQTVFEGHGASRRALRSIGTLQDITTLKKNETALRRANQELEQFAYAAAHDLQEPLRNISLAAETLAAPLQFASDPEYAFLIQNAIDSSQRAQQMIRGLRLLSISLASEEPIQPVDADIALSLALKTLRHQTTEKGACITFDPLPPVLISQAHLVDLFQRLLHNSLKFSGSHPPLIHVSSVWRGGVCTFYVKDNGLGIAPEYHSRAFKVFKQLHGRELGGTGIGLTLCKRIVEHYGGNIWIESRSGQGATILFTPPVAGDLSHRHHNEQNETERL